MKHERPYDVVGIGAGPANLSLAALLHQARDVKALFLDARADFAWHPGLMIPGATLQSPHLKDLVTLVDPCNPFSFFNYLVKERRAYRFLVANAPAVTRREFEAYYRWAAHALPSVRFSSRVQSVRHDNGLFLIEAEGSIVLSRHIVVGSGAQPVVPPCVADVSDAVAFHASRFLERKADLAGKTVAVVGGGQTGAEVLQHLLRPGNSVPKVMWISRRSNFIPLDVSPFANELFTPAYADHFYHLPAELRSGLLQEQKYASDGISQNLLEQIYQRLYDIDYVERDGPQYELLPGREVIGVTPRESGGVQLQLQCDKFIEERQADVVVLCTGYTHALPDYLASIHPHIERDAAGNPHVRRDFSLAWTHEASNRIFVQGMARHFRGVAEPNLGLMSWRSAHVVNALLGRPLYDLSTAPSPVTWPTVWPY